MGALILWLHKCTGDKETHKFVYCDTELPHADRVSMRDWAEGRPALQPAFQKERPPRPGEPKEPIKLC